jgi:chemotaxis protein methyltransferase CheR
VRDLVHRHSGLFFDDDKKYFVEKRVENRMEQLGIAQIEQYIRCLETDVCGGEMRSLVEELTVNETYFFRNKPQLDGFSAKVLPQLIEAKRSVNNLSLRIWSAACSTGEEAYTLAMIVHEALIDIAQWRVMVLGTDIDRKVLRTAHRAVYTKRPVEHVPPQLLARYFVQTDNTWQVVQEITKHVQFRQINLVDKHEMRNMRDFDVIFCRNTLIYFNDASRRQVLNHFYDALRPGGLIFLGHSESVGQITAAFRIVRLGDFLCYAK